MRRANRSTPTDDLIPDARIPPELQRAVQLTTLDKLLSGLYNWGRKRSMYPMLFGLACCGIEMICTWASRFDIERRALRSSRGNRAKVEHDHVGERFE